MYESVYSIIYNVNVGLRKDAVIFFKDRTVLGQYFKHLQIVLASEKNNYRYPP